MKEHVPAIIVAFLVVLLLLLIAMALARLVRILCLPKPPQQTEEEAGFVNWRNPALDMIAPDQASKSRLWRCLSDDRLWRAVVFAMVLSICYPWIFVTSYGGFLHSMEAEKGPSYLLMLYAIAWTFWFLMGAGWIADRRLGLAIAATGTIAGVLSLIAGGFIILPFLILPILLAIKMARFHSADTTAHQDGATTPPPS